MGCVQIKKLISINDISKQDIISILDNASNSNNDPVLKGKIMATLFFEPSTRTRMSFESAMHRLGGDVIGFTNPKATSFVKGESLSDAAKMIENYCDIMVIRNPEEGSVKSMADAVKIPVINAGDGSNEHPSQALLDLYSIQQCQGKLDGLKVALLGDIKYSRCIHSLAKAFKHFNSELFFISPKELSMQKEILTELDKYQELENVSDIISEIDILYVTRVQKERFSNPADYKRLKDYYVITPEIIKNAKDNMRIISPLPRTVELTPEVDDTKHAYYFQQASFAVSVRKALLKLMLG